MTYYITEASKAKNQAYTASLLEQKHIIESAYKRGIYEFYNGSLITVATPDDLMPVMVARATAIIQGTPIDKYNVRLTNAGYVVKDYYNHDQTVYEGSELCIVQVASNPYKVGSLYAAEWQRGYDTGYFRNLKNVRAAESKKREKNALRKK